MDSLAARLFEALTSGFEPFVAARLTALGVDPAGSAEEMAEARQNLQRELGALLANPFAAQAAAPLQLVRRALRPVTAALIAGGLQPPPRDASLERLFPDDPFDLGPASAADLGEEALQASIAWGAAKADAVARPLALVVSRNLMDVARFEEGATAAGYRLSAAASGSIAGDAVVAFVDLEGDGADEAVSSLAQAGVRVVAYGPHVDDVAMLRARSLGASVAEPRSRVLKDPARYLPPLV